MYISINLNINILSIIYFVLYLLCVLLASNITLAVPIPTTLNLNINNEYITTFENSRNNTLYKSYVPNGNYLIDVIKDGDDIIWDGGDNERCLFVLYITNFLNQRALFLRLFNYNTIDIYEIYVNILNIWEKENIINYNNENGIILDLNDMNEYNLITDTNFGNRIIHYAINLNQYIYQIKDGNDIIWNSNINNNEKLINCKLYIRRYEINYLYIETIINTLCNYYYYKSNTNINSLDDINLINWSIVSRNEFENNIYYIINEIYIDILNLYNNPFINVVDNLMFNLITLNCIPNPDKRVTELRDGNNIIWSSRNNDYLSFMILHFKDDIARLIIADKIHSGLDGLCYFKRSIDSKWYNIPSESYHRVIFRLNGERIFNINDEPPFMRNLNEITNVGNMITLHLTLMSIFIVKVVDGDQIIWEITNDNAECINAEKFSRKGINVLLKLEFLYEDISVIHRKLNINGIWTPIDADEYNRLALRIENESIIDVNARQYNYQLSIDRHYTNGTVAFSYLAHDLTWISTITDGEQIIWEHGEWDSPNEPKCTFVVVHLDGNGPQLLNLYIKTPEPNDGNIYYIKLDEGNWIQVTKEEFYTKLEEIDQEIENGQRENPESIYL